MKYGQRFLFICLVFIAGSFFISDRHSIAHQLIGSAVDNTSRSCALVSLVTTNDNEFIVASCIVTRRLRVLSPGREIIVFAVNPNDATKEFLTFCGAEVRAVGNILPENPLLYPLEHPVRRERFHAGVDTWRSRVQECQNKFWGATLGREFDAYVWVDSDTLPLKDLSFMCDVKFSGLIAPLYDPSSETLLHVPGFPRVPRINAGVMAVPHLSANLYQDMVEQMMAWKHTLALQSSEDDLWEFLQLDQGLINYFFRESLWLLPRSFSYHVDTPHHDFMRDTDTGCEIRKEVYVLHYVGSSKPWYKEVEARPPCSQDFAAWLWWREVENLKHDLRNTTFSITSFFSSSEAL